MGDDNVLVIRVVGDDAGFTSVMRQVDRTIKKASTSADGATKSFSRMGHGTVSNTQAASAAIRLMEGDLNNMVRAAENFVGRSKMLSNALRYAFPVIGAVAILSVLGRGIQRLNEFVKAAQQAPEKIQNSFRTMSLGIETSTESLRIKTLQTEDELNKLLGKPAVNGPAIALEQAKKVADQFAASLLETQNRLTDLMKTNSVSAWQTIAGVVVRGKGEVSTKPYAGAITSYSQQMADLAYQRKEATDAGDKAKATALNKQIDQKLASFNRWTQSTLNYLHDRQNLNVARAGRYDYSAAINEVEGSNLVINDRFANVKANTDANAAADRLKKVQAQKELQKQAAAAQRAAQQAQIKSWQQALDQQKSYHSMTLGEEANYWISRASTVKYGSLSYKAALDSAYKLIGQQRKQYAGEMDIWKGFGVYNDTNYTTSTGDTKRGSMAPHDLSQNRDVVANLHSQGQAAGQYLQALGRSITLRQQASYALQSQSIDLGVATGQMSKMQAAEATAALHAREYADALTTLQRALRNVANDPTLSALEKKAQTGDLNNQIMQLKTNGLLQRRADSADIYSNTLGGSIKQTFSLYLNEATDTAHQIEDVMTQAFQSVNSSVASALMTKTHTGREFRQNLGNAFGGAVRGVGSSILDKTFQNIEGKFLKKLLGGHNKADGSAANPYYVRMAGASGTASGAAGAAANALSKSGGILGLFGSLFQGFFAGGGDVLSNRPAIVGERGPELFVPRSAGSIIPNHMLAGGSTIHNHSYMIDARGSHDPAATEAAVHRGMSAVMSATPSTSIAAVADYRRRTPTSKQRA